MKKSLIVAAFAAVVGLTMSACTSINTNDGASDSKQAMVPAVYEPVIKHVDKKVTGKAQIHVLFGLFTWGAEGFADRTVMGANSPFSILPSGREMAKDASVYNACTKNKCDLLLSTKYKLTVKDFFVYQNITCDVAGFPGTEVGVVKKEVAFPKAFNGNMELKVVELK